MKPGAHCLIVGIGNPDRGDDGVGALVARRLQADDAQGVRVVEHTGEAADLLERLSGVDTAYLIDAAVTGALPGSITRFDAAATPLAGSAFACSTHGLGLLEAIELARALGRLPRRCVVYAIEGRQYEVGHRLSPQVAAAAEEVATLIRQELRSRHAERS